MKNERGTWEAFGLFLCLGTIFLFALTFCNGNQHEPSHDLHDKLLKWADKELAKP